VGLNINNIISYNYLVKINGIEGWKEQFGTVFPSPIFLKNSKTKVSCKAILTPKSPI